MLAYMYEMNQPPQLMSSSNNENGFTPLSLNARLHIWDERISRSSHQLTGIHLYGNIFLPQLVFYVQKTITSPLMLVLLFIEPFGVSFPPKHLSRYPGYKLVAAGPQPHDLSERMRRLRLCPAAFHILINALGCLNAWWVSRDQYFL